jgi:hypothetical protein
MLTRRTVILAKRETLYGTDPAMAPSTDGILVYDVDMDIKGEKLERPVLRDSLSPMPHVIGMKSCTLKFKAELKGMGTTTSIGSFELDDLLSGVGFDTGVYTGTSTVYSLQSQESLMSSVSFIVNIDGNIHKILGAKGSAKFNLEAGKYGECEFEFQGLFNPIGTGTLYDLSGISNVKPPIVYNSAFQIGGFSPVCSKAEIDLGVNVVQRDSLNATYGVAGYRITDRTPMLNFDADAVTESSNPFWGDWEGSVVDTFGIQIGSNPTNIIKMNGYFEYESNKYGDQDGIRKYDCKAALVSSDVNSQNNELSITFI